MDVKELLLSQWDSCMDQEDWFLPLEDALKDVTAEQSVWKPADGPANSIRETVQHLLFYDKRLLLRVKGQSEGLPEAEDNNGTFAYDDASEAGWEAAKNELYAAHRELSSILAKAAPEDLSRPIPDEKSLAEAIRSLAMHDAYHIGQIVLLSKLQGAWPATRSFD
ncbi:DinB family protein [Saccharibacillus sp. CPCC 101409]|uniref:DinB family protein n=1 Tax=Saccharibacillus sp. CPCC 101409 TaxID=3058041 RepID=UPI002670F282|nr:DinB family protein [Saccharibacillus sp. CPCC 101409]MDO3412212.1 DinB family protein [Saccharibacillus sp. CPCC 101409]